MGSPVKTRNFKIAAIILFVVFIVLQLATFLFGSLGIALGDLSFSLSQDLGMFFINVGEFLKYDLREISLEAAIAGAVTYLVSTFLSRE